MLFRAMTPAQDGQPVLGRGPRSLGVREPGDPKPDVVEVDGRVHRPARHEGRAPPDSVYRGTFGHTPAFKNGKYLEILDTGTIAVTIFRIDIPQYS